MFSWYRQVSKGERYTFWACFGGWALDALDVQMFSLVIPAIIAEWGISKTQAGLVSGVTLVASALGGWICGAAADRYGRVKTLQVTVVFFSVFTLLSAFAQNYPQFIVLKALQGFGFGGEWAAGAVLMAETIRNEHRGKAMGAVQSAWAVGWAAAVLLYATVFSFMSPDIGWRVMFGIGILPALLIIYIRRNVKEPGCARAQGGGTEGREGTHAAPVDLRARRNTHDADRRPAGRGRTRRLLGADHLAADLSEDRASSFSAEHRRLSGGDHRGIFLRLPGRVAVAGPHRATPDHPAVLRVLRGRR